MSERSDRRGAIVAAALALTTWAVLLSLRGGTQVGDSMSYAVSIKTGWRLFHPHHLLFAPIVRLFWLPLSWAIDAITAAQIHNAAWAAVAVTGVFSIVRRTTRSLTQGAAAGALLLATYGSLFYGTQVEVYLPAAACSTLLMLALLGERPRPILVGLLALAVFYHQPNVLLCVPVVVILTCRAGREGLREAARVVGVAGVLVLATYVAVYVGHDGPASVRGFIDFALRYAVGGYSEAWGSAENVGAQGLGAMLRSQLAGFVTLEDGAAATAAPVLGVAIAFLVAWNAVRARRDPESAGARWLLLSWLLVDQLFFLWWQPGQPEFFIAPLVPLVLLFVLFVSDLSGSLGFRRISGVAIGLLALVLLVTNLRQIRATVASTGRPVADAYLSLVPEDCFHLSFRNVMQTLRYDFDLPPERSYNVKLARRRMVSGTDIERVPALSPADCVVTPGHEVVPGPKSDDAQAAGWMRYYTWLFRLDATGAGVRGPFVRLVADGVGPFYLVQGPADVEYADLPAFFRELDRVLADRSAGPVFEPWFEANRSKLLENR